MRNPGPYPQRSKRELVALNDRFSCFVSLLPEVSAPTAVVGEQPAQPLSGVTVVVKDCIPIAGVLCTWGSGVFADRRADSDAEIVVRLRAAGAVLVATTNLHEFAFGGTTQNPWFGDCRNAWQPDRVPGGSSGGSAVAVALGAAALGIGTDTGSSVRMPASLNGVLGLRPTHGAISTAAVMPVSPPHDTVGFLARDLDVLRRTVRCTYGQDPKDPHSRPPQPPAFAGDLKPDGTRLAIMTALLEGTDDDVADAFDLALSRLSARGFSIASELDRRFVEAGERIAPLVMADAADFHGERLRTDAARIGSAVHQRIARGLSMTATEYASHLRWKERFCADVLGKFRTTDFLLAPTVPITAPRVNEVDDAVTSTALLSRNCWAAPGAGLPALSVPCGVDRHGVPIGLQIVGPPWSEEALLCVAETLLGPSGRVSASPLSLV